MQDVDAGNDLVGALAHQAVVGSDIGLAFHRIDHQFFHPLVVAQVHLDAGGEAGAAHAGDARMTDGVHQFTGAALGVVGHTGVFDPFILAVGVDDDTDGIHPGRVLNGARADGADGAGGGGMNGRAHRAAGFSNHLAFQYPLTGFHQRFGRGADVHVQRQYQLRRHRAGDNGGAVGKRFPFRRVNTAVEVVDLAAA